MNVQETLKTHLPSCLYCLLENTADVEELRMRRGCRVLLRAGGILISTALLCTDDLMEETLSLVTDRSFYKHAETLKEGYISLSCGIRVGIAGTAITTGTNVDSIKDITFLSLRIPGCIPGVADPLIGKLKQYDFRRGALLYSLPGVGKTTVLRECARFLSGRLLLATALIDTRNELSFSLEHCPALTVYQSYPKAQAVEMAVRTVSPDVIILDEIGEKECAALLETAPSGVPVVASAHGKCIADLVARPSLKRLLDEGVFPILAGLNRKGKQMEYIFS